MTKACRVLRKGSPPTLKKNKKKVLTRYIEDAIISIETRKGKVVKNDKRTDDG